MAYYTEEANAVEVPIWRISDDAQFRAYTTPDNYYFILLDENYETNVWIPAEDRFGNTDIIFRRVYMALTILA